jgi:hypothetical protein
VDVVPCHANVWRFRSANCGVQLPFMQAQLDVVPLLVPLSAVALGRANWDVGRLDFGQRGTRCQQDDH